MTCRFTAIQSRCGLVIEPRFLSNQVPGIFINYMWILNPSTISHANSHAI